VTAPTLQVGSTAQDPVDPGTPCACGPLDLVDIATFVSAGKDENEDGMISLDPATLTNYSGDRELDLPCGRFYLGPVHGQGALTSKATGRVALLIDGDLQMTAPLTVELDGDDAEIDLMIAGLLTSNDTIRIGDPAHPARSRIYVGGSGQMLMSGDSQVAA